MMQTSRFQSFVTNAHELGVLLRLDIQGNVNVNVILPRAAHGTVLDFGIHFGNKA